MVRDGQLWCKKLRVRVRAGRRKSSVNPAVNGYTFRTRKDKAAEGERSAQRFSCCAQLSITVPTMATWLLEIFSTFFTVQFMLSPADLTWFNKALVYTVFFFFFCLSSKRGQLLKKQKCSFREQIISFKG